jgi:putative ABC transport system substrate-binding protein
VYLPQPIGLSFWAITALRRIEYKDERLSQQGRRTWFCTTPEKMSRRRFLAVSTLLAMPSSLVARDTLKNSVLIGVQSTGHNDPQLYRNLQTHLQKSQKGSFVALTIREASFSRERLALQLDELLMRDLDVLICMDLFAATVARSRRRGTNPPIVFIAHADPLASHLILAYSEPGNNLTGVSTYRCVDGKMVEIMGDAFPARKRIGYLLDSSVREDIDCIRLADDAAKLNRIQLVKIDVASPAFLSSLRKTLLALRLDAIVAPASAAIWQNKKRVVDVVNDLHLPAIYESTLFLDEGGLLSYGPSDADVLTDVARAVEMILRGQPAGQIPVEQPTRYELVVNLRAPHANEYEPKATIFRRADRILE